MNYKEIFVESKYAIYPISIFSEDELNFIRNFNDGKGKKLIIEIGDKFKVNFVGELRTPENNFYSVPKNFKPIGRNIEIFNKVLENHYKVDGESLRINDTFRITESGFKSEKFYYKELKEYFLDFITYEFIYPKSNILKHSTSPISKSKIDVLSTIRNRKRKGPGITYKIKDLKNTESWNLDDIYWTVIDELSTKYNDKKEINEMKSFLFEEGYKFKNIDIKNIDKIKNDINKCDVGVIHLPIKNTLLAYFNSMSVGKSYSIKAFYTDNFARVWEVLIGICLVNSESFKSKVKKLFTTYKPTRRKYEEGDIPTQYRELIPDIFSGHNNKFFIGDAKYYEDPENSNFDKEMYVYNQLINNQYPMCVFIPSNVTRRIDVREHGNFQLIVFKISAEDAIEDVIKNDTRTIEKIHELIFKNSSDDRLKGGNFK